MANCVLTSTVPLISQRDTIASARDTTSPLSAYCIFFQDLTRFVATHILALFTCFFVSVAYAAH